MFPGEQYSGTKLRADSRHGGGGQQPRGDGHFDLRADKQGARRAEELEKSIADTIEKGKTGDHSRQHRSGPPAPNRHANGNFRYATARYYLFPLGLFSVDQGSAPNTCGWIDISLAVSLDAVFVDQKVSLIPGH